MNTEMKVRVWLPTVLRVHTGGESRAMLSGSNVDQILIQLVGLYPALRTHLFDDHGMLHSFITIFRNETNIRDLQFLETELSDGDEVRILPAVAGG
jgi:molybdopterin converting factor small subunit